VTWRRELLSGRDRLLATTAVLQRARLSDPLRGMWEGADVQWWWRKPRATDDLALSVWFDEEGPVAAVGLTDWNDTCQVDAFCVSSTVDLDEVWAATLDAAAQYCTSPLELLVLGEDTLIDLAMASGFEMTSDTSGTAWMDAEQRFAYVPADNFALRDRRDVGDLAHPMIARNGDGVQERLMQCSLYNPALDLALYDGAGQLAGYALFWYDEITRVGLLEPMRIEDDFQRRGLGHVLVTAGLERLAELGARRMKVGFESDIARKLYVGAGYVQTSHDRLLRRAPA
jgi:predicted N-acetyltransferase YhbS